MPPGTCHCSRCDQWLPRESFGNDKQRADGRKAWCRLCRSEARRTYYTANRESILARGVEYDRRNWDAVLERKRRWRASNRDRVREIGRAWRQRHPDKALMKNAKRRGATLVEPVAPDAVLAKFGGKCGVCGEELGGSRIEFDHIVPLAMGGAHTEDNLRPAHPACNRKMWAEARRAAQCQVA